MNFLMQRYWIVKGTSVVRRVINSCTQCRRRFAKPNLQLMAELPFSRLQIDTHPFAYCGVDYFGPLIVRHKRSEIKRYGCLFTCLTTRAVHIEVAADLSTDAFINALRRFMSRRGPVFHFYSDNGTNIVGGERILRESLKECNQQQIEHYLLQREVQWTFNPPNASHMGGSWERMIKTIRRILISLSGERELNDDQLQTFLLEAESIINSRPLTPITMDIDSQEPLTPNHLLKLYPAPALPPTVTSKDDCYARRRWRHIQFLADKFWTRWSREYLKTIVSRQKWHHLKSNLKLNDVVLIVDDASPRSHWRLGKITKTFPDEHGVVRQVLVKTRGHEVRRPIHKLCLVLPADLPVPSREISDDPATNLGK